MFWYSGLSRILRAVALSGAWRETRRSQLLLVSSISAHSSPRGAHPARAKALAATCWAPPADRARPEGGERVGSGRPSAWANRRAGSTVTTSTRPPRWQAAMAAIEAGTVVLPTPPGPHTTTISLAATRASIVVGPRPGPVNSRAPPRVRPPPGGSTAG